MDHPKDHSLFGLGLPGSWFLDIHPGRERIHIPPKGKFGKSSTQSMVVSGSPKRW